METDRQPPKAGTTGLLIVVALLVAFGVIVSLMIFLQQLSTDLGKVPDPPEALLWSVPEVAPDLKVMRGEFVFRSKTWVEIKGLTVEQIQARLATGEVLPDVICLLQGASGSDWAPDGPNWVRLDPPIATVSDGETARRLQAWARRDSRNLVVAQSYVRWLRSFGGPEALRAPGDWSFPAGDAWVKGPSWRVTLPAEVAQNWDAHFHDFAVLHGIEIVRALRQADSGLASFIERHPAGIAAGTGAPPRLQAGLTPWPGGRFGATDENWLYWPPDHPQHHLLQQLKSTLDAITPRASGLENSVSGD